MDIISRLNLFVNSTGKSSSQFADELGIPRPSMSQILNGRNKKISNELIEKLHQSYPTLNILWLLFGEGDMRRSSDNVVLNQHQQIPATPLSSENNSDLQNETTSMSEDINQNTYNNENTLILEEHKNSINNEGKYDPLNIEDGFSSTNSEDEYNSANTEETRGHNLFSFNIPNHPEEISLHKDTPTPTDTQKDKQKDKQQDKPKEQQKDEPIKQPENKSAPGISQHSSVNDVEKTFISTEKKIKIIMVFYTDKSYQVFKPEDED